MRTTDIVVAEFSNRQGRVSFRLDTDNRLHVVQKGTHPGLTRDQWALLGRRLVAHAEATA